MDDLKLENVMQIIMHAGNAKSAALLAIAAAEDSDFEAAAAQIENARSEMGKAHELQFGMIQQEAQGIPVEVNIMLVHAQDHLSMAITAIDFAERFISLYRRLDAQSA